jgi:hypothetical protein
MINKQTLLKVQLCILPYLGGAICLPKILLVVVSTDSLDGMTDKEIQALTN